MSTEVTSSSGTSGRQQLQHQPTAFCNDDLYNPALTYEQRARIRQLKRKAKTSGDLSLDLSTALSQPFRTTASPIPSAPSPTLGHISSYAYVAALSQGRTSPLSSPSSSQSFSPLLRHSPNPASAASGIFKFDSFPQTDPHSSHSESCSNSKPHSDAMSTSSDTRLKYKCNGESAMDAQSSNSSPSTTKAKGSPSATSTRLVVKTNSTSLKTSPNLRRISPSSRQTVNVTSKVTTQRGTAVISKSGSSSPKTVDKVHSPRSKTGMSPRMDHTSRQDKQKPIATTGEPSPTTTSTELPSGAADNIFSSWDSIGSRFANADSSGASSQSSSTQSTPRTIRSTLSKQSPRSSRAPDSPQKPRSVLHSPSQQRSANVTPSFPPTFTHVAHSDCQPSSTKIVFRHDLTDSLSQEANIVMFGHKELSDSDQDEQSDVQPKHQLSFRTSVAESGDGASHMMTVVPSTPERRVVENNHEAEAKNATVEHAKTEKKKGVVEQKQGKKDGRRLSALLSSGKKSKFSAKAAKTQGDSKKEESKGAKKNKSGKQDKPAVGLFRKNSLPLTHTSPLSTSGSDDIVSPDPPKERSLLRRWSLTKKSGDKAASSLQKTGWRFRDREIQKGSSPGLFPARSEMFLAVIGEDNKPEPEPELCTNMRTQSLTCLYMAGNMMAASLSQEMELPVTVVQPCSPNDALSDEIEVIIPDLPCDDKTVSELDNRDYLFQSPVSISSITLDIPGLTLPNDGGYSPKPMAKFRPASVPLGTICTPLVGKHDEEEAEQKSKEDLGRERKTKSTEPNKLLHGESNDSLDEVSSPSQFKRFATSRKPIRKLSTTAVLESPVPKLKKRSSSFAPHDCQQAGNGRPQSAGLPRLRKVANSASTSSLASLSSGSSSCLSTPKASHKSLSLTSTPTTTPVSVRKSTGASTPKRTPTNSPKSSPLSRRSIAMNKTSSSPKQTTPKQSPKTSPLVKQRSGRRMGPALSDRTGTPATTTVPLRSSKHSLPSLTKDSQQQSPPTTPKERTRKHPIAPAQPEQWMKKKTVVNQRSLSATPSQSPASACKLPQLLLSEESTVSSSMNLDAEAILKGVGSSSSLGETSSEQSSPTPLRRGTPRSSGRKAARPAPPPPSRSPRMAKKKSVENTTVKQMKRTESSSSSKSSSSSPSHSTPGHKKPSRVAPPPPSRSPTPSQASSCTVMSKTVSPQMSDITPVGVEMGKEDKMDSKQLDHVIQSSNTSSPTDTAKTDQFSPPPSTDSDTGTDSTKTKPEVTSPTHRKPSRPAPPPPQAKRTSKALKTPVTNQADRSTKGLSIQSSVSPSPFPSSPTAQRPAVRVSPAVKRAVIAKKRQQAQEDVKPNTSKQSGSIAVRRKAKKGGRDSGDPDSPIPSTMDLLSPVNSLLSTSLSSTDTEQTAASLPGSLIKIKLEDEPLSPPSIATMPVRPFSPSTPVDLEPPLQDIPVSAITPEVPVWSETLSQTPSSQGREDEQLTYIYRQTLLRKSSRPDTSTLERRRGSITRSTSNNKLPMASRSDSKLLQMNRSSSKGRPSLLSSADTKKNSTLDRMSMRRTSSGMSRQLGPTRPLSGSNARQSIRKSTSGTLPQPDTTAKQQTTRSSVRIKRTSVPNTLQHRVTATTSATVSSNKPPTGKPSKLSVTETSQSLSQSSPQSTMSHSLKVAGDERRSMRHSTGTAPSKLRAKSATTRNTLERSAPGRSSMSGSLLTKNNSATMLRTSKRFSRASSGSVRKVSQVSNTYGTLTKRPTPPPSTPSSKHASPSHHRSSRGSSVDRDEMLSAFDHVSALAEKSMMSASSVSRLAIRPKTRQKPSSRHIQMLNTRKDVSSELQSSSSADTSGVDPNAYATYMGKKVLHTSALAGLAAKLDFTTVKLRKTGIVEQMMVDPDDPASGERMMHRKAAHNDATNTYGVEITTHNMMLLKIKGRKQVQTRLVEPVSESLNSGDVFVLVRGRQLFLWLGKSANVIEKARGNDVAARIFQKKELGCHASGFVTIEEGQRKDLSLREKEFLDLLGANKDIKITPATGVPTDEVYEKAVSLATRVYVYNGERGQFDIIYENIPQMIKIGLLDSKKVLLFDFYGEVYVWIGKHSPPAIRKPAVVKGREMFDAGCTPPVFTQSSPSHKLSVSSPNRASGRFRQRSGTLRASGRGSTRRKSSKTAPMIKGAIQPRPSSWALFRKVTEGAETILFREKFVDWPEPGRIIKMKGHESSGESIKAPPMPELQPADITTMLKQPPPFEGLRLDGENIHRGCGNFKVSRSTFACNRVRLSSISIWHIKEYDKVLLTDKDVGLFYSGEGYVVRWGYTITVVRELEGLTPGTGGFARDRLLNKKQSKKKDEPSSMKASSSDTGGGSDSESDSSEDKDENSGDEVQRVLESGGRERCAYFFWQGDHASVNEKGAVALMTVELDEEKGPQVRVPQRKEPPAFLQLFNGGMIILCGQSGQSTIYRHSRGYRLYSVSGLVKAEALLLEVDLHNKSLCYYLRARGCYVLHHMTFNTIYVWVGTHTNEQLKSVAMHAARRLRKRLGISIKVVMVHQHSEPVELHSLLGDCSNQTTISNSISTTATNVDSCLMSQHVRLFEMSSSGGWFVANEVLHTARSDSINPFLFLQDDLYTADQPGLFLLDAWCVVYLWLGWWPQQKNTLLQEKNALTGSAHSRWLRDKKLALQTALNYANGSGRPHTPAVYVVCAGSEHHEFIKLFPFWNENIDVQEITCKGTTCVPKRVDAESELAKYSRTQFTLSELRTFPHPEGVDPSRLESYLSEADFLNVFTISHDKFQHLPNWKQVELKKKVGLF